MYKDYDLYLAAKNGHLGEFERILDRVSRDEMLLDTYILSRLSHAGNTFLHVAAKHGNQDIVAFIARRNSSLLFAKNFNGETALHLVAKAGDEFMVKALLEIHRGREESEVLMVENEMGNTALHEALFAGHETIARFLIEQCPQLSYHRNNHGESPIYLAAKAGLVRCVSAILHLSTDEERLNELFKNRSPIKAATKKNHKAVLETMFDAKPELIEMSDTKGRTPLHFAAYWGRLEVARYLLPKLKETSKTQRDEDGAMPIHLAAFEGHVEVIKLLLQDYSDAEELLDKDGCNILHIAAKRGRYNVFRFALKNPRLNYLINMKDKLGNTPLHWASYQCYPRIVNALTWNNEVDIKAVNKNRKTALDVALLCNNDRKLAEDLTWGVLVSASDPCYFVKENSYRDFAEMKTLHREGSDGNRSSSKDEVRELANTYLLVGTLVATVTFAAGFTVPGGYNSSESKADVGMATMLRDKAFYMFVFCDTIALYSSIVAVAVLVWAHYGDTKVAYYAMDLASPLLVIALGMMTMAFTAGIYVVVSKLKWLSTTMLVLFCLTIILFLLYFPLSIPSIPRSRILRYITYYPFLFLILVSEINE